MAEEQVSGFVRFSDVMRWLILTAAASLLCSPVLAERVSIEVREGVNASARYSPGEPGQPIVLILHGFLQTYDFSTVARLHSSLAEAGMTVLSPNLSLGIDQRKQSLSCEAIHTHTLEQDVAELDQWVAWLWSRYQRPLVLIGHSAGGVILNRYLYENPGAPVGQGVLISLSYLKGEPKSSSKGPLGEYRLGFCQTYTSVPEGYRSYVDWGAERMIAAMQGQGSRVSVILGSGDKRISTYWRQLLAGSGVEVVNVEGADHFFDNAHEFDLFEAVDGLLADSGGAISVYGNRP